MDRESAERHHARTCPAETQAESQALLALYEVARDHYRVDPFPNGLLRLYGGQISSQALRAAQLSVASGRAAHSLHAYFAEPGEVDRPLDFHVTRDRDGRSFSSRRVLVEQDGRPLLTLSASFHIPEPGKAYGLPTPSMETKPEALPKLVDYVRAVGDRVPERHRPVWLREGIIDWRPTEPLRFVDPIEGDGPRDFWFRPCCPISDDLAAQQCFLLYASDIHILHTAMGRLDEPVASDLWQTSSLDHAVWFHDRFDLNGWLLYRTEAVAAGNARALGRGAIFAPDGRHVATVMQEGLVRALKEPRLGRL